MHANKCENENKKIEKSMPEMTPILGWSEEKWKHIISIYISH